MDQTALSASAKSQRAEYRQQDDAPNRYCVNVYFDHGEGFLRRETIADKLTKRQAESLTNALNRAARALAQAREEFTYPPLTDDQLAALFRFASIAGRHWKQSLRDGWQHGTNTAELQHLRNTHGPRWLDGFKLPREERQ